MSLPRQISSHSPSPSKSSLRRTSGPANPSPRDPTLLPSPHLDNNHLANTHDFPQPDDSGSYDGNAAESSTRPSPPNFHPFFTLIEDPITHEHHHPTVHYIFADDDADIVTEAACRSLEDTEDDGSQALAPSTTADKDSRYLPSPAPGVKEHYLVLDVRPTITTSPTAPVEDTAGPSYEVTQAHSLSSEWQVLRTNITQAPTIGHSPEDEGLMLRIEGRGNTPPDIAAAQDNQKQSLEEMIVRFQRRLEDVRLVIGGAGSTAEKDT